MSLAVQATRKEARTGEHFFMELIPDLAGFGVGRCHGEDPRAESGRVVAQPLLGAPPYSWNLLAPWVGLV